MGVSILKFVPGRGLVVTDLYKHVVRDSSVFDDAQGTLTLNLSLGNAWNLRVVGELTLDVQVNPDGEDYQQFLLVLEQDNIGNHPVILNIPIMWAQEIPVVNTNPLSRSVLAFFTLNKGISFIATYVDIINE